MLALQKILDQWKISVTIQEIEARWTEKHRYYHDITHLEQLLTDIRNLDVSKRLYQKLVLIALFHDIIYVPGNTDNELRSADFFMSRCRQINPDIEEIRIAIIDTKEHSNSNQLSFMFNKLDMKIFEADWYDLIRWEKGIQKEYLQKYSKQQYKHGRISFLRSIIKKYPNNYLNLSKLISWIESDF